MTYIIAERMCKKCGKSFVFCYDSVTEGCVKMTDCKCDELEGEKTKGEPLHKNAND